MTNVIETIGLPATLEQTAEECAELNHACLKLARKLRGENYTPASYDNISANLIEEMADVLVCINKLIDSQLICSIEEIETIFESKCKRWEQRVAVDN